MNPLSSSSSAAQAASKTNTDQAGVSSSSASQPMTQLVTCTALTTLAASQTDAKLVSPVLEEMQKHTSSLLGILKMHTPDMTMDDIRLLSFQDVLQLSQFVLLLIPAKTNSPNATAAFHNFFSHKCHSTPNPTLALRAYGDLWKACGIPARDHKILLDFYNAAVFLFKNSKMVMAQIAVQAPIKQREATFNHIARLIRDVSFIFEAYWSVASKEVHSKLYEHLLDTQGVAQNKKSAKADGANKKLIFFTSAEYHGIVTETLLKQLQLCTFKRLPTLKYHCSRLDISTHASLGQFESLQTTVQHCQSRVSNLANQLIAEYARYESDMGYSNGAFPVSDQAKKLTRELYNLLQTSDAFLYTRAASFISSFRKAHEEELKRTPHSGVIKSFAQLEAFLKAKSLPPEPTSKKLEKTSKILDRFTIEFLENLKETRRLHYEKLYTPLFQQLRTDEEIPAWIQARLNIFAEKFQQHQENCKLLTNYPLDHPKGHPLDAALFFFQRECDTCIEELQTNLNSDNLYDIWLKQHIEEREKNRHRLGKTYLASKKHSENIVKEAADNIVNAEGLKNSVNIFCSLFSPLAITRKGLLEAETKKCAVEADRCLSLLELEEETRAAKKAYEDAELAAKQKKEKEAKLSSLFMHKIAAAAEPTAKTTTATTTTTTTPVVMPTRATSTFNTSAGQLLHDLRNELAAWHGMNPAKSVLPGDTAGSSASIPELAVLQQLYANDNFATSLEMLSQCKKAEDKALAIQMVLQWGYLALEQGLTTEYAKKFPNSFLRHDLSLLLNGLEMDCKGLWTEQANSETLYHRYPWNFTASGSSVLPFALKHIREGNPESAKDFCSHISTWVSDAASMQIAVITHHHKGNQTLPLKRIQTIVDDFRKGSTDQSKETYELQEKEKLSEQNDSTLTVLEKKLDGALTLIHKRFSTQPPLSNDALKALYNARHHLRSLKAAIGLLTRFPQQRFMHVLLHSMLSSVKDFAENLGVVLSLQKEGDGWYSHSLGSYFHEYGLGKDLKKNLLAIMKTIDIEKGNEYPYKYFAHTSTQAASSVMVSLSEFYGRSKEAVLMGEGAIPSGMKKKSVVELQSEICEWVKKFAELACALATKHLS